MRDQWHQADLALRDRSVSLRQRTDYVSLFDQLVNASESYSYPDKPDSNLVYATWLTIRELDEDYSSDQCTAAHERFAIVLDVLAMRSVEGHSITWRPNLPSWWELKDSLRWYNYRFSRELLECVGASVGTIAFLEERSYDAVLSSDDWSPYIHAWQRLREFCDTEPVAMEVLGDRLTRIERRLQFRYLPRCHRALSTAVSAFEADHGAPPLLPDTGDMQVLVALLDQYLSDIDKRLLSSVDIVEYSSLTGRIRLSLRGLQP